MRLLRAAALALVAMTAIAAADVLAPVLPGPMAASRCQLRDPERLGIYDGRRGTLVTEISAEIAATPAERERGLMARPALPGGRGMLFLYPSPRLVAYWMKNTLIPLDMLFIDESGVIVTLHENAVPGDETPIPSGAPVRYVLEIGGGQARALGLAPGMAVIALRGEKRGIPLSDCGIDR